MESGLKAVKPSPSTPARVTDMKNALLLSLGVVALSSCVSTGYDSFEECVLREEQKGGSRYAAASYCRAEYPRERAPTANPFIDGTSEQQSSPWDWLQFPLGVLIVYPIWWVVSTRLGIGKMGRKEKRRRERRNEKRRREGRNE